MKTGKNKYKQGRFAAAKIHSKKELMLKMGELIPKPWPLTLSS